MTTAQVLEDFTRDELRQMIWATTQRSLGVTQFYEWLPYCLIPEAKPFYTKRDVAKFLFVAGQMNRIRNLELAQQKLIERIQNYPEEFEL